MMRVAGPKDLAHVACADPLEDFVMAESLEHGMATIILTR
jgi:hypothetical protein